jgi:hypothetical protein
VVGCVRLSPPKYSFNTGNGEDEQNWGPEGVVLISAATADWMLTVFFALIALVLMIASGFNGAPALAGYLMFVPMVGFGSVGIARSLHAIKTGRRFRRGRPFQR